MRAFLRLVGWSLCVGLVVVGCGGDKEKDRMPGGTGGSVGVSGSGGGGAGGTDTAGTGGTDIGGTGGTTPPDGGTGKVFDAGSDPNRNAVMPGTICERLATIQCAGESFCCDNPGRDFETCKQVQKDGCATEYMVDEVAANPAAGFNAAQALVFFTELERLASTCDPMTASFGESPQGLRTLVNGTIEPEHNCTSSRPWIKVEAAAALASCTQNEAYACLPRADGPWICEPHAAAGGDCFSDGNCQVGVYCDNPDLDPSGSICKTRKAEGEACQRFGECLSLFCKGGACVPATQQNAYCLKQ